MKRTALSFTLLALLGSQVNAQIGTGGLPLSIQTGKASDAVPVVNAALPDWENGLQEWEKQPGARPYLVALNTPLEVAFPDSGTFSTTENGTRVWRVQINVAGAPAIGLYYDHFRLPEGVKLYLSNASGKQILGAYTDANNSPSSEFATEAIQGGLVNLELNIEPGVDVAAINLHINKAATYFRGIEYLQSFKGDLQFIDAYDDALTGRSSVCMINAICPEGNNYVNQRNAAFQWLIPVGQGVGACSATMINSTGNTGSTCKQYFLLASHCDGSNATTNAAFNQVLLRYNFQHATCNPAAGTIPGTTKTLTGANFLSRSIVNVNDPANIKGDFLLMETRSAIPESWNVNLAGWNNAANIPTTQAAPKKFIGFHHPGGDAKKVSSSQQIQSYSLGTAESHWATILATGLVAQGSSGSALFDGDGRVIGVASVAGAGQGVPANCNLDALGNNVAASTSNTVLYSKLSYDWDYNVDGSTNSSKLKPWLDPANTGATTTNTVKSTCAPLSGSTAITNSNKLDDGIALFPNPSSTGKVTLKLNLNEATDLYMDLYDVTGKKVNSYSLKKVSSGSFGLDLSQYANGMYLLQLSDGYHKTSKKIMLAK